MYHPASGSTASTRLLLGLIALGLLLAGIGATLSYFQDAASSGALVVATGTNFAQLTGLFLLLRTGTLLHTHFFKAISFCFGLTLLGALFKIMHWALADVLLLGSTAGILMLYAIHFWQKPQKHLLDVLKLLWVVAACTTAAAVIMHWMPRELTYVPRALFWLCLLAFVRQPVRQ